MRGWAALLWAVALTVPLGAAQAAERGVIIRAGDLMDQPFIDAGKAAPVGANQPVTILERRAGWLRVEAGGHGGWVRMLNVRLDGAAAGPVAGKPGFAALRTGSSGKTVTTGIKGLGEEDIRQASPDYQQLDALGTLAVDPAETRENAAKNQLKESTTAYLKKGRNR
jgi:hypothetical protein